jgi:hypothetical protein
MTIDEITLDKMTVKKMKGDIVKGDMKGDNIILSYNKGLLKKMFIKFWHIRWRFQPQLKFKNYVVGQNRILKSTV